MFAYCLNNPVNCIDNNGYFPWVVAIVLLGSAFIGAIWGATTDDNLSETIGSQDQSNKKPQNPLLLPTPTRDNKQTHPPYIDNSKKTQVSTVDTKATNSNNPSTTNRELSTKDRINNTIIGATVGLMGGGAALILGGAAACVAGYTSVSIPFLAVTGKQAVAWGILAYDVFPITVAPFLGMEMEVLEYPS